MDDVSLDSTKWVTLLLIAPTGASQLVAAACDDGSIRMFTPAAGGEHGLVYERSLAKVEGRSLTVAWHPSGHVLVSAGSDGCIHCWRVKTGG